MELCDEEYRELAKCFTVPGGMSMLVKHLKGKDEAGWEAFVKGEGGPHGLVSAWLVEHELEDYLKPTLKKAKSGDSSGSGSSSSNSASPGKKHDSS